MGAWTTTSDPNTPRCSRRFASLAKMPSAALSHEAEIEVKWKVRRGWRSSQGDRRTQGDRHRAEPYPVRKRERLPEGAGRADLDLGLGIRGTGTEGVSDPDAEAWRSTFEPGPDSSV